MYVQAPLGFKRENLHDFRTSLNHAVLADLKSNKENITNAVLNVEIMSKSNLYQFQVRITSELGQVVILIETQTYVQINYRNFSYNIGQQIGSLYQDHCSNSETDRSNQTVIRRRSCQCSWSNSSTKWI